MSDEPRKRVLLNDRQVRLFLKDMHTFGYTNLTFEETRRIADEVAAGTHSVEDPVARLMASQIDEAMEAIAERRRPYE